MGRLSCPCPQSHPGPRWELGPRRLVRAFRNQNPGRARNQGTRIGTQATKATEEMVLGSREAGAAWKGRKFSSEAVGNDAQESTGIQSLGRQVFSPLPQGSRAGGVPAGGSGGCHSSIRGQQRPNFWAGPLKVSGRGVWGVPTGSPRSLTSLALLSSIPSPQTLCWAQELLQAASPLPPMQGCSIRRSAESWGKSTISRDLHVLLQCAA